MALRVERQSARKSKTKMVGEPAWQVATNPLTTVPILELGKNCLVLERSTIIRSCAWLLMTLWILR